MRYGMSEKMLHCMKVVTNDLSHVVLRIMENQVISSVPVVDSDRTLWEWNEEIGNLIGIFQRTDLIKLDFHDMSVFNYPISTFISSVDVISLVES